MRTYMPKWGWDFSKENNSYYKSDGKCDIDVKKEVI